MAPNSDARALIRAARIGSPGALNELLGLFRAQIRYEAGIRLEGALKSKLDSSDAAQGVLMRATERFDQFRGESPAEFTAWLRTILANHLRDEQRRYRAKDALLNSVLFFVVYTLHRTSLYRLFDTILGPTLGQDDFGLFFFLVKGKYFRAKLNTAFTANAFVSINDNNFSHGIISLI